MQQVPCVFSTYQHGLIFGQGMHSWAPPKTGTRCHTRVVGVGLCCASCGVHMQHMRQNQGWGFVPGPYVQVARHVATWASEPWMAHDPYYRWPLLAWYANKALMHALYCSTEL